MYYSGWVAKNKPQNQAADIPHFLSFKSLQPFISKHLGDLQSIVVKYKNHKGYDYEHRLDVLWLCKKHHLEADRAMKK